MGETGAILSLVHARRRAWRTLPRPGDRCPHLDASERVSGERRGYDGVRDDARARVRLVVVDAYARVREIASLGASHRAVTRRRGTHERDVTRHTLGEFVDLESPRVSRASSRFRAAV